jgi:DnaJ-class molecular chaperone
MKTNIVKLVCYKCGGNGEIIRNVNAMPIKFKCEKCEGEGKIIVNKDKEWIRL